jgi:hypothetical protein
MDQHTERRAKERHHALMAIEWLEYAIYAIERADYQATEHAISIARMHLVNAEVQEHVRVD